LSSFGAERREDRPKANYGYSFWLKLQDDFSRVIDYFSIRNQDVERM
jgi:hypothetical protein